MATKAHRDAVSTVAIGCMTGAGLMPDEITLRRYEQEIEAPTMPEGHTARSMAIIVEGVLDARDAAIEANRALLREAADALDCFDDSRTGFRFSDLIRRLREAAK